MTRKTMSKKTTKILEHAHESYKLIYIIIMTIPLAVSLENLLLSENPITGIAQLKDFQQIQLSEILLFIVFLILFVRFFLGDLRLLDSKYIESQYEDFDPKKYKQITRFIDFYSLIFHAIFFYILAATLYNFVTFYKIFTFLLFFNALWLTCCFFSVPKKERKRIEIKNTIKWAINNVIFACLLLSFLVISRELSWKYSLFIFFILANSNSIVDYIFTWDTYFPLIE